MRSLYNRDLPVIQGLILYVAVVYVLVNLLVDVSTRTSTPGSARADPMRAWRTIGCRRPRATGRESRVAAGADEAAGAAAP